MLYNKQNQKLFQNNPVTNLNMPKSMSIPNPLIGSTASAYYGSPFMNAPQTPPVPFYNPFYNPFMPSSLAGSYLYPFQSSNYLYGSGFGSGFGMPYYIDYNLYGNNGINPLFNNLIGNQNFDQSQPNQERRLCKKSTSESDLSKKKRDLKEISNTKFTPDTKNESKQFFKSLKDINKQKSNQTNEKLEAEKNLDIQPKIIEKEVTKKLKLDKKNYDTKTNVKR